MGFKLPLDCIMRCFYCVYYAKFLLAFFNPALAKEWTDFSGASDVTSAYETWGYFFTALLWTAATQFDDSKSQRKATQYGMVGSGLKLAVLYQYGADALGSDSNAFYLTLAENLVLFLGSLMTVYVWYPMKTPKKTSGKTEFTDCKTAIRIAYAEQFVLATVSCFYLYEGQLSKLVVSDAGMFGAAMAAANQLGSAVFLMGVSQCESDDIKKVTQYSMFKKLISLFYLTVLIAPASDLTSAYMAAAWEVLSFVHMKICCYGSMQLLRTSIFWTYATAGFYLGALGLFHSNVAGMIYNVPELSGANDTVFKLVGLGAMLQGTTMYAFSKTVFMDNYEVFFAKVYGPLMAYFYFTTGDFLDFGVFSVLLNLFLVYALYMNFSKDAIKQLRPFGALVPKAVRKSVGKVVEAVSPKTSPMKNMRRRSKTPGRKSS